MRWTVLAKNIVDYPAEVVICSANTALNLSGGTGGELLKRYGPTVQAALHEQLKIEGRRFANPGDVISTHVAMTPYKAIIHAVAVDAFYKSSIRMISAIVREALNKAAANGGRTVVLAALATGYGSLTLEEFAQGILPLLSEEYPPIENVTICLEEGERARELSIAIEKGLQTVLRSGKTIGRRGDPA